MRIAQINFTRINNSIGGVEKVFFTMANELTERGHYVACFYYDAVKGRPTFPINEKVYLKNCYDSIITRCKNVLFRIIACFIRDKKKRHFIRDFSRNNYIYHNVKNFDPDIIIFYWPDSSLYKLLTIKRPIIQMFHMDPSQFVKNPSFQYALEWLRHCYALQVSIPEQVESLRQITAHERIVNIGNIVPQYHDKAELEAKKIIFLGRLTEDKRPQLLLRAFAILKDKYPDWQVEIWGPLSESKTVDEIKALQRELALQEQVFICGATMDVASKIRQASIVAMPSIHEGFCLALAECMSMGLPAVVCRDCATLSSLVHHEKTGLLCDPTPEGIACQLERLMSDQPLRKRFGAEACSNMRQFCTEKVITAWEHLMREAIERNPEKR